MAKLIRSVPEIMMMEHPETESTTAADTQPEAASPGGGAILAGTPTDSPIEYGPSGRRLYTWDELPPKVRLRAEHEGKWVAWSADGEAIVASAGDLRVLDGEVMQAGFVGAIYEYIDLPRRECSRL